MIIFLLTMLILIQEGYRETPDDDAIYLMEEKMKEFQLHIKNDRFVILIDYTKNIFQKRLWVYDLKNDSVLVHSEVSHSIKSGLLYAYDFSDEIGSEKTPRGAFITGNSYFGKFGYSMRLHGLEEGVNKNSLKRFITFHPNVNFFWSDGCFMTDEETSRKIIDLTKGGCFMYVYGGK
jgi:hypothetical protein